MTQIAVKKVQQPGTLPDEDKLGFGKIFTDHMLEIDYETGKGWYNPQIVPYTDITMAPAAMVLHYGQAIFEGMKAFKTADNKIVMYRAKDHLKRFNNSARCLCIPQMDEELLLQAIKQLLEIEKKWVPGKPGTALYIRPFVIATDPYIGVKVADHYKLYVILSPVGAYYASGFKPVKIKVEEKYVRTVKGGLGEAKTPANYAASLMASEEAAKEGYTQVLWLDGVEKKYIEEVGTMNIFFKIDGEIITPALNGSILPGITRKTVLELGRAWKMKVSERQISIDEVYEAYEKGKLEEVFGSGTAAIISPVGELLWRGKKIVLNNNQTGPLSQRLFDHITGIQTGKVADEFGWISEVVKL